MAPAVTPASGVLQTPSGILAPIRGTRDDGSGWVVGTPCGGEAVVAGGTTLAPVQVLIDHLTAGFSLDEFLATVSESDSA